MVRTFGIGQQLWCTLMFCFLFRFWTQSYSNSGWSSSTSAFWTTDLNRNTVTDVWKHTVVAATLCVQEQATARALSTNTQKIFSSLAGWLLLGTCVHPHSREKMVAQQPQKKSTPGVWWCCYRAACIKAASIRKYERWTYSPPPETSHLICMCDFAFAAHGGCDPRLWPEQFSVTEYAQMCSS